MPKQIATKQAVTRLIHRSNVNGLSFADYGLYAQQLVPGVELTIIAHDDNSHDDKAIGVYFETPEGDYEIDGRSFARIGWMPNNLDVSRGAKNVLWNLLDAGLTFRCKILSHDPKANFATRLFMGIWLVQA